MSRLFHLAMLAMAPMAQARFGRLQGRQNSAECCPCAAQNQGTATANVTQLAAATKTETITVTQSGVAPKTETVTVTQAAAASKTETVTVTQSGTTLKAETVTVSQSAAALTTETLTVTQSAGALKTETITVTPLAGASKTETVTIQQTVKGSDATVTATATVTRTVQSGLETPTVNVINGAPQPSASPPATDSQPGAVTNTAEVGGESREGPKSGADKATINIQPSQQTVTITSVGHPPVSAAAPGSASVVTVTVNPLPSGGSTRASESVMTSPPAAVTVPPVPPQFQTVVESIFETVTKTVSAGGGDNIEIIIINVITGKSTCRKKHSGKACHARNHSSAPFPTGAVSAGAVSNGTRPTGACSSAKHSSSIAAPYNTVFPTLGSVGTVGTVGTGVFGTGVPHNATSAFGAVYPTGAANPATMSKVRKPTGPRSKRSW